MSGEVPERRKANSRGSRPPSRKLNLSSRVRGSFRRGSDWILGADYAWSGAFVVVVMLLLGSQRCGRELPPFVVGETAPYDIAAIYDIDVVDQALTEERWRQAREEILDVYAYDTGHRGRMIRVLGSVFEEGRRALEEASLEGLSDPQSAAAARLVGRAPPDVLQALLAQGFDVRLERDLVGALGTTLDGPIVGNKALLERQPAIVLTHVPGGKSEKIESYGDFLDLDTARAKLVREVSQMLDLRPEQEAVLARYVGSFVDANVHLDPEATNRRREAAARAVPPVLVRVARGDLLIKQGDRFTQESLDRLDAARRGSKSMLGVREVLALLFVSSMLAFFVFRYSGYHQRGFSKLEHLHALLVLMLLSMLLLAQGVLWLSHKVVDNLGEPYNQLGLYTYLVPLGAGAILVALLANGRIATVYAAFAALLFGAVNGADFYLMLWAVAVQLSGVYAITTYRERAALLRAGLVVGGAGMLTVVAIETIKGDLEPLSRSLYGGGLAFVGGAVGVGLLISFSLPLLERLFNVLTDVRLLELSNINNPLLSQLAVKAPGSYNHSLVVGTLAEEAAKAIEANSLFCRVAAFYHDIGKIPHAEYYVENQRGVNPHDRLSPSMSALVISSHVKDGIKMAREAGLPEQVIDIIPQHHGTKLMTYFYEKAKSSSDPTLGPVKEEDFRYPGPKPQTREAAIFMLADAVEAAARTVEEPTANRLREMIRKITNSIVLDGQLDSCDLTFADLQGIQTSFLKLLVSMYHQRVDYPGFEFGKPKSRPRPSAEAQERRVAKGS